MPQFFNSNPLLPSYILAGWRLKTQLPQMIFLVLFITTRYGLHRKNSSSIVAWICLRGTVLTQSLHSNGYTRHISYRDSSCIVECEQHQAATVPLPPQLLLWANMPQYLHYKVRTNLKRWIIYASSHCWLLIQLGNPLSRETTAIVTIVSSSLWCSIVRYMFMNGLLLEYIELHSRKR
jgi:hypothetical protein